MHELFELSETVAVDPGASPFHVRGMFYTRVQQQAREMPGGLEAFLDRLSDRRVRAFMETRFKWMDWYDALPTTTVQMALSAAVGEDFETATRARTRSTAKDIVPRMFRFVLGLRQAETATQHVPRLFSNYFDYGQTAIDRIDRGTATYTITQVPRPLAAGYVNTVVGVLEGGLELMRASNIRSGYRDVVEAPELHGYPTLSCRVQFQWDA